jgi:hypothetical protein
MFHEKKQLGQSDSFKTLGRNLKDNCRHIYYSWHHVHSISITNFIAKYSFPFSHSKFKLELISILEVTFAAVTPNDLCNILRWILDRRTELYLVVLIPS